MDKTEKASGSSDPEDNNDEADLDAKAKNLADQEVNKLFVL